MPSGHPDWQTWAGRSVGGETIDSINFFDNIESDETVLFNLPVVPDGEEHFYQNLSISSSNDSAVHFISLIVVATGGIWWSQDFVIGGNWDLPGFKFTAGNQAQIQVTNSSAGTYLFIGNIFRTIRKV